MADLRKTRVEMATGGGPSTAAAGAGAGAAPPPASALLSRSVSDVLKRSGMQLVEDASGSLSMAGGGGGGAAADPADIGVTLGRPDVATGGGSNVVRRYKHEGVWGPLRCEGGSAHAWSCCGNSDERSRGCASFTVAHDRYCFLSF